MRTATVSRRMRLKQAISNPSAIHAQTFSPYPPRSRHVRPGTDIGERTERAIVMNRAPKEARLWGARRAMTAV